jgi:hypothetical protein
MAIKQKRSYWCRKAASGPQPAAPAGSGYRDDQQDVWITEKTRGSIGPPRHDLDINDESKRKAANAP